MSTQLHSWLEDREFAHDVLNHLHVILGNLELLAEERPEEWLVTDARDAAMALSRMFRRTSGP